MNNEKKLFDAEEEIIEKEDTNSGSLMEDPFNPSQIDIVTKPLTIDLILKRLSANPSEIDLSPAFQRKSDLWDDVRQSQLIESLLIKFPLPAFYFDGSDNNKWLVVDGLQRLCSLRNFIIKKELKLTGLEYLNKLENLKFDQLERHLQRQIEETQITAYIINAGTPSEVKFNIFKRINTGGLILNSQEIRHALNQGIPAKYIEELANIDEFKKAVGNINTDRMLDRELITMFLAFRISPISEYKPELDKYLNTKMGDLKKLSDKEREEIKASFKSSMVVAKEIFGKYCFRKFRNFEDKIDPINKALFEVWTTELSKLTENERKNLIIRKDFLINAFLELLNNNDDFVNSISTSTGNKVRVNYRFSKINEIIKNTLNK